MTGRHKQEIIIYDLYSLMLTRPVKTYEKPLQDLDVVIVRPQMQEIAPGFLENAFTLLRLVKKILLIIRTHQVIARVNPIPAAGLGVFRFDHSDGWQLHIHFIIDLYPD